MSELGQQDTQDGFHEIQLSGKQLVFLFMATTIVAVVIFLCGVQVGRNVKTDRAGDAAETVATAAPAASASTAPLAQPAAHAGRWIVQLTALQDRAAAAAIARRLTAKGYPAFVLDPAAGAPVIYRVQVGGYADRREADQVARRLEKDEQFKTYVRPR